MAFPSADDKGSSGRVVKIEMKNFLSSSQGEAVKKKHKGYYEIVLRRFLESIYIYHDSAPMELSAPELRTVVLETLPRCFSGDEEYLNQIPAIVSAYWEYLDENASLEDAAGFEKVLTEMRKKFTKTSKKVKTADRLYAEDAGQLKSDKEKVGRNDPCPCGSGKKYKKCCQLKGK